MSVIMPPPPPTSAVPPSRPLSAKEAKADAKAAKARAKSLRPWYRKKRFILVIAIVAIIVIAIASNASKKSSSPTSSGPTPTVAGVNQGAGSADASGECLWCHTWTARRPRIPGGHLDGDEPQQQEVKLP